MKPPYAIGSVPSLSDHANAYRWRSLPRVRRHRASKPHGISQRVLPWQVTMDQLICASLSHTQGALSELEEETQEAISKHEREQQLKEGEAERTSGSANLEGPALPALRKLAIDGNIPPIFSSRTRNRRPHTGMEGEALHCFLPTIEAEEENGVEDALACDDGGHMAMQATLDTPEPRHWRQAMESPEWDGWRKAEENEMLGMVENSVYKHVVRPKDKLVVGTKMLYKRKIGQDCKVEYYKYRHVAQGF